MKLTIEVTNQNLERTIGSLLEEAREVTRLGFANRPNHIGMIADRNAQKKAATFAFQRGDLKAAIEHQNSANLMDVEIAKAKASEFTTRIFEGIGTLRMKHIAQAETPEQYVACAK